MNRVDEAFTANGLKMFDKISAGILFTDSQKNILYANPAFCRLYRTSLDKIRNKTCWSIIHPESEECGKCLDSENIQIESMICGKKYYLLISCSQLSKDLLLKIIHDISKILGDLSMLRAEVSNLSDIVESTVGTSQPLVVCCGCHKIRLKDGSWVPPADVDAIQLRKGLSHGDCPSCSKKWIKELGIICDNLP